MAVNNLWQAFNATAARHGQRSAIQTPGEAYSFGALAQRAGDLRAALRSQGVGRGDRVLLWMRNDFHMAAALLACWGEDAVAVLADDSGRGPQLEHALATTAPELVVCVSELPLGADDLAVSVVNAGEVPAAANPGVMPAPRALPTDPASIVFTSGSTGWPKGVVQSHGNLFRGCRAVASYLGLETGDVLLCPVPWSFDYGYGQLLSTLLLGLTHVIPALNNPAGICEAIDSCRPKVLAGTPAVFAYLVGGMSPIADTDCRSLRLLTSSGGRVAASVREGIFGYFEAADLVLNYGLTETYRSCFLPPGRARECGDALGVSIPGVEVTVLDAEGQRAAPHCEGEIIHRGDYICLGYWGNEAATRERIRPDPLAHRGLAMPPPCVYTGDIGYLDDRGLLHFVGRRDRLLKSMGVRVSPQEVEDILLSSGLLVAAAVYGVVHPVLGHEVRAAVVPATPATFELRALQQYARRQLTQYMQPRQIHVLDALPRTSSGKTDYTALEKQFAPAT